ncbi:hypothetical protein [Dyella mobilis]|uniref:Uncharacterized protein n=1 Tax=Dyella mobilis TaxID=1849582 RepID=A0ABS2KCJ2_9GAMM|nr:hypothetical protein [Dyella mobilis]MBM7128887.1 hypothetical protein [Dyella mobilis]GLQ99422.1 hypothetical protein GCM10007863_38420 [Dyella mobilis]
MTDICKLATADKARLAREVGRDLLRQQGKKAYYDVASIQAATCRQGFPEGWECWVVALYASPFTFAAYRARAGENFDYVVMHGSMVEAISEDANATQLIHHDLAGTDGQRLSGFLDSLAATENAARPDFPSGAIGNLPTRSDVRGSGDSAPKPTPHPRIYRTPTDQRVLYGVAAMLALALLLYILRDIVRHGIGLEDAFLSLVGGTFAGAYGYRAIAPQSVEMTEKSLVVEQLFSATRLIKRDDVAFCNLSYNRSGARLEIRHRDPAMQPIILCSLNFDDAFWAWFSGVPGKHP